MAKLDHHSADPSETFGQLTWLSKPSQERDTSWLLVLAEPHKWILYEPSLSTWHLAQDSFVNDMFVGGISMMPSKA